MKQLTRTLRILASDLQPAARRLVDVLVALTALTLLGPLLLVVAILIKLESRGPLFFHQLRGGLYGRPFRMWKLRTMVADSEAIRRRLEKARAADAGPRFKMRRDPRITGVGRVLRKLSIDELPQLFNVLAGDMTLVGPRPAPLRECALYDTRALRRMEVRPGLTCFWQVQGRSDLSFEEQVRLDIEYVDTADGVSDLKILLATVPAVITGRGAY